MKRVLLIITILYSLTSQNSKQINTDFFLGKYSMRIEGDYIEVFEIIIKGNDFLLKDFKSVNEELIKLRVFKKDELNSDIYKKLPNDAKILGNESYFMICKVPKLWSYGNFTCETGYFIVTVAGPLNVNKN